MSSAGLRVRLLFTHITGASSVGPLERAGHAVTGVDISAVQIQRARSLVPGAHVIRADPACVASQVDGPA